MQTSVFRHRSSLSIKTSFPGIPTTKENEGRGEEGHLLGRGRLVEEIRYSLFIPFFRADIILFKVSDELLYFAQ